VQQDLAAPGVLPRFLPEPADAAAAAACFAGARPPCAMGDCDGTGTATWAGPDVAGTGDDAPGTSGACAGRTALHAMLAESTQALL